MDSSNIQTSLLLIILLAFSLPTTPISTRSLDHVQSSFLKVADSEFASSIKSIKNAIKNLTTIVTKFSNVANFNNNLSLSTDISDCLELLDLSSDALSQSLSAIENPIGNNYMGTGDLSSDIRTWLSAAITYQETCIEGFDVTNSFLKETVAQSINKVTPLIKQLLAMVHPDVVTLNPKPQHCNPKFPSWISEKDGQFIESTINELTPNVTVSLDGTGNYTNVADAIWNAPDHSFSRYVIYVKKGVYREYVDIKTSKMNIMIVGDGIDETIISGNRNCVDGWKTYHSATFSVSGNRFIARDITFENTAGPAKHQAVALRSDSDLSVFLRCKITGYQDTLYPHAQRQFYRECTISGTVDFICGRATVVFQKCNILARKGLDGQKNTITAQSREDTNCPSGFIIHACNISADTELLHSLNSTYTYMGRPWKLHSRTVVMQSYISDIIRPEGWLEWNTSFALDTLFYGEYSNHGPGADLRGRVKWPGFHVINDSAEAQHFTVSEFIAGDWWLPNTGVGYNGGLEH